MRTTGDVAIFLSAGEMSAVRLGLRTLTLTAMRRDELYANAAAALAKMPDLEGSTGPGQEATAMIEKVTLPVIGLSLGGCGALTIERELRRLGGVSEVYVNPATDNAYVHYDSNRINAYAIAAKIRELGYETELPKRSAS